MTYTDVRHRIRSGHLLAWSSKGWGNWYEIQHHIIRVLTESEYVHVGLAWRLAGRVFVLEASKDGVRIYPLSRRIPFYWSRTGMRWDEDVERYALEHFGDQFSKVRAWQAWMGWLKRSNKPHLWQCAEFVSAVLRRGDYNLNCDMTPEATIKANLGRGHPLYYISKL